MSEMRRVITALSVCLLIALGGCSGNAVRREDDAPKPNVSRRFVCDGDDYAAYEFSTVVDSQTGVTYLVWKSGSGNTSKGGITVLVDEDGKPIISEEVEK